MRWAKTSLRNSFLGWKANKPVVDPSERMEEMRKAMLQVLEDGMAHTNATLERKILFARNIEELWYVRPELMNAIAAGLGESVARARLAQITEMFEPGSSGKPGISKWSFFPRR